MTQNVTELRFFAPQKDLKLARICIRITWPTKELKMNCRVVAGTNGRTHLRAPGAISFDNLLQFSFFGVVLKIEKETMQKQRNRSTIILM